MKKILTALLVAAALTGWAQPARADNGCTPSRNWGAVNIGYAKQVVELTNAQRVKAGLPTLQVSLSLTNAAMYGALHASYFGNPQSTDAEQEATSCGYPAPMTETIAWGSYISPQAVVNEWMGDPTDRGVTLWAGARYIGVGVARGSHGWQMFRYFGAAPDNLSGDPYANFENWPVANSDGSISGDSPSAPAAPAPKKAQGFSPLISVLTVRRGRAAVSNVTRFAMLADGTTVKVAVVKVLKPAAGKAVRVSRSSIRYTAPKHSARRTVTVRFEFRSAAGKTGWGLLKVHIVA